MRITAVQTIVVNVSPFTNWTFVRLETDDGIAGVGEATLIGFEPAVASLVGEIGAPLVGRNPLEAGPLHMTQGGHIAAAALSGLEQALWDIRGKAYGVPVHRLLGGGRAAVPVYANINRGTRDRSPRGVGARAEEAVSAGFGAVKFAPFDEYLWWEAAGRRDLLEPGIRRVEAIRETVGPRVAVKVDCHWRFDVPAAIEVGRRLAALDLAWYEAPVSERDPDAVREVREQTGLRIAGGELQTSLLDYRRLLEARCMDVLMPDVKYVGGIQGVLKVATLAEAFGASIAPHNPSGPVATAATLHAAAVLPNLMTVEYQFAEVEWYWDLVQVEFAVKDGHMQVPQSPGLGVNFDMALAAKYPYQPVRHMQDPRLFV